MLEYIRSSAQSFGVKVAFGVIILVFVFWGVGNFNDRDYSNVVAVVNGQPIVALEFEKAYMDAEEYLLRNNPGLTREQLAKEHLGRQVLNELIQQTLLAQEAERTGIRVSPGELRAAIYGIQAFQDQNGKFDPEAYKRVLAARRISVADYEKNLADQLRRDKMFALLTAGAWIDPEEARHRFDFLKERRVVDYIFLPASDFAKNVKISDADIDKWYQEHQGDFAVPPMVNVEYITVRPEALADRGKVSDEAARAWYEANRGKFERKEQIHASHILVPLAVDADEAALKEAVGKLEKIKADIAGGKSFAEVADAVNPAGAAEKGGDLGWLARGETVPEFEEAAFALPVGQISEPVRTPFGLHLVTVAEKKEAAITPFAEVIDQAKEGVAFEEGSDKLHDALDAIIEDNILMKPLAEVAARHNLQAEKTGLLDKNGLMSKLSLKPEAAEALLAAADGGALDTALEAGNNYIVARIIESRPASTKPLADVRETVRKTLESREAEKLALADADKLLERVRKESLDKIRAEKFNLKTGDPVERAGMLPGFLPNDALMRGIFSTSLNNWLPKALPAMEPNGQEGAIIAYVAKIIPAPDDEFAGVAKIFDNAAQQQRKQGLFNIFMDNLFRNAEIQVMNQNIIDRVDA